MGVGNKYHVASLVAVFFALALGVLVGVSITSQEKDIHTDWIRAIEREMRSLRTDHQRVASSLHEATKERDSLKALSEALMTFALSGNMEGQTITIKHIGDGSKDGKDHKVTDVLEGDYTKIETLFKTARASIIPFAPISDDTQVSPPDFGDDPPVVILFVDGPPDQYGVEVMETIERFRKAGVTRFVAASTGDEGWNNMFQRLGIAFVSHPQTIYGQLSLVLLSNADSQGSYGQDGERYDKLWPDHLLAR